jgi:hypothetical protein
MEIAVAAFTAINESIVEKNHWYYSWKHHSSHARGPYYCK